MSTPSVLRKTRRLLGDYGETFSSTIPGDGVTTRFEMEYTIIDEVTVGTMPASGGTITMLPTTAYSVDAYNGLITLTTPVAEGELVVVNGTYYDYFNDTDLTDYVMQAFAQHTATRNPQVYLDPISGAVPPTPVLPVIEERPVAILAAKLVLDDKATEASANITIDTGDGTVVPRSQSYQQYVQESSRLDGEYRRLVAELGLQTFATATVVNLRRVSMTTNRLIPEYVEREWDNRNWPQRILPPIDTGITEIGVGAVVTERGQWLGNINYAVNDLVFMNGVEYLCLVANVGISPASDVAGGDGTSGSFWQISYINSGFPGFSGTGVW